MKPVVIKFFIFFWILLAIDCILIVLQLQEYRIFTKPLLMPVLLIALLIQTSGSMHIRSKFLISGALFFSFVGDVVLLNDSDAIYFILALTAFLAAHIFYTVFFFHVHTISKKNAWVLPLSALLIIGYEYFLLSYLWDNLILDKLLAPVLVYAMIIGIMLFSAIKTVTGRRIQKAAYYFIPGALLFVASDTFLALYKFAGHFVDADFLIMLTYGAAQFLLTLGAIKIIKE